ncbi:hypothetical protein [Variovorax sp. PCZ-1]|uniref:hypothetical protein n=1 Tax=Variovorax sp. PCZ-1 TaxID=2835533 RepID=UPI001BCD5147|nr:hypothetical protein [Variovorax sp. PCZ-1]MBS7807436.1 hypothetical protein [Variovorax sp. PCZ-1]
MSLVTDVLDRLTGINSVKERLITQDKVIDQMQKIMLDQQRELAEVKGMLKALVTMQSGKALPAERKR